MCQDRRGGHLLGHLGFPLRSLWKARSLFPASEVFMRVSVLLQITTDDGAMMTPEEVAVFDKTTERAEDIGLLLEDGKALLAAVQRRIVETLSLIHI